MLDDLVSTADLSGTDGLGRAAQRAPEVAAMIGAIAVLGTVVTFGRDREIYGQGEPADYLYKVLNGTVRTSKILSDGRRQIVSFYLPGDMFGFEIGTDHTFSAESVTHSKVLVVRRSALAALARQDAAVAQQMWKLAGRELARIQAHILLLVKNAQERVVSFLVEMADRRPAGCPIELTMSRQDIADHLGLTIETVSRTLTALDKEGTIRLLTPHSVIMRRRAGLAPLSA